MQTRLERSLFASEPRPARGALSRAPADAPSGGRLPSRFGLAPRVAIVRS
jgi:hypothetical protein